MGNFDEPKPSRRKTNKKRGENREMPVGVIIKNLEGPLGWGGGKIFKVTEQLRSQRKMVGKAKLTAATKPEKTGEAQVGGG